MSHPKLISPLLDGYSIGNAISDHDGVCCSPAVKENSENKYIVKVISIPAAQTQLDALLLTGAYKDPASAMEYFKELADGVIAEADTLKKLSKLEGFLPYENWQIVPMEKNQLGYHVYLLGSFKRSLDRYMRRNPMTHLAAINLGLDLCAALAIARRAGWMYVDVKPSNIFISEDREYRIGDLGFVKMDSLKFSSLPRKYCSPYSAPEVRDAMAILNDTIDTYAVGMLLYQIYNNGQLPAEDHPDEEPLPAPANADYELAEIILKACAPLPKDRWSDPMEMGQALVAYMQRNTVNDIPIVPPEAGSDLVTDNISIQGLADETLPSAEDIEDSAESFSESAVKDALTDSLPISELPSSDILPLPEAMEELEVPASSDAPKKPIRNIFQALFNKEAGDEDFEDDDDDDDDDDDECGTEDEEDIIEKAGASVENEDQEYSDGQTDDSQDLIVSLDERRRKTRYKRNIIFAVSMILILALCVGGIWFYRNYYLLTVNELNVSATANDLTVSLDTQVDNTLLIVVCIDTYGNSVSQSVENNQAVFTGLQSDMLYKIRVEVSGFHGLQGSTTHEYLTPAITSITDFTAAVGPEDGSVALTFGVEGPETDEWIVTYTAEEEETKQLTFNGHSVVVSDLTVGKNYTFDLAPASELELAGQTSVDFTAVNIVIAKRLRVSAGADNKLVVSWDAPAESNVANWTLHCYSSDGYDQTVTTAETSVTLDGISTGSAYTVEVVAEGMTQAARTNITADPANITSVSIDDSDPAQLTVSWQYTGSEPATGWILMYSIDGNPRQEVVKCEGNTGVIELRVPNATYDITIQAADGSSVFNNTHTYECPGTKAYENNKVYFYARGVVTNMLVTPQNPNWSYKEVSQRDFRTTFTSGEPISVMLYHQGKFYLERFNTKIMYVIRDHEGNVLSDLVSMDERVWREMWQNTSYHYCELNIPAVPTRAGDYTLEIYFNGYSVTSVNFTITE